MGLNELHCFGDIVICKHAHTEQQESLIDIIFFPQPCFANLWTALVQNFIQLMSEAWQSL